MSTLGKRGRETGKLLLVLKGLHMYKGTDLPCVTREEQGEGYMEIDFSCM